MHRRYIAMLFLCLSAAVLLTGCGGKKGGDYALVENGECQYTVIVPENASADEKNASALLKSVIKQSTGVSVSSKDDWLDEKRGEQPGEFEILIGNTNRIESTEIYSSLTPYTSLWCESNGKLVFAGNGENTVTEAVAGFLREKLGYSVEGDTVNCKSTSEITFDKEEKSVKNIYSQTDLPAADEKAFESGEGYLRLKSGAFDLDFVETEDGYIVKLCSEGRAMYVSETPSTVRVISEASLGNEKQYGRTYGSVFRVDCGYVAASEVGTENGSSFLITDVWYPLDGAFCVDRTVKITKNKAKDKGYASLLSFSDANGNDDRNGYEYFIPGLLFRDTSYMETTNGFGASLASDLSGDRTYVKELNVPLPSVMARNKASGDSLMLQHVSPDVDPETLVVDDVVINDGINYGAVGYSFDKTLSLDFVYPSSEGPVNYEHGGSSWRCKYNTVKAGNTQSYTLALIPGRYGSYNDAMTESYLTAYGLEAPEIKTDVDNDKLVREQYEIYRNFYTEYVSANGEMSAGLYFDASVMTGKNFSPISYLIGFSGAQAAAGYQIYRQGVLTGDKDLTEKGKNMLDMWSSGKITNSELPVVWWNPDSRARMSGTVNTTYNDFLRVFVDGMEALLDAAAFAKEQGTDGSAWKKAALKTADFLVENQSAEGTWCRAYDRYGNPVKGNTSTKNITTAVIWKGFDGESPLVTYVAVRFLAKAYDLTGEAKYRDAAVKAAEWSYNKLYLEFGKYVGACPDHINIVDKESSIYAMYCFETAYALTGEEKYLKAWKHAAVNSMSFVYVYDFNIEKASNADFAKVNVLKDGGIMGMSLIATGYSVVDAYGTRITSDMFDLYAVTGEKIWLDFAKFIQYNTKSTFNIDGRYGWKYDGLSVEACSWNTHIFSTAGDGVWLPWVSDCLITPYLSLTDTYGSGNVTDIADRYSSDELSEMWAKANK